jgi:Leucine-rich repeat (LRR) protein
LCKCITLKQLCLSENSAFTHLPERIGDLQLLESLDLTMCKMEQFPDSLALLPKLKTFKVRRLWRVSALPQFTNTSEIANLDL